MDDVTNMTNEELRTQANETISEWDDIEAHLGSENKASIDLFHSRSDDIRVMLEEAVRRLELAGPAPRPAATMEFTELAERLDELIGGLRGRVDGGTIQELLEASQSVYAVILSQPGVVRDQIRSDLSEQARKQADEERRAIEEVRAAAPEVEEATSDERREIISKVMEDVEGVAEFPEGTGNRYEWHVVATGVGGVVEARAFSHESGPDPDESKRLFEEMWKAYEMIYNDAPNSISVNIEDLS